MIKTLKYKCSNNTAKTKEGTDGQTWRRFKRIDIAVVFENVLALNQKQSTALVTVLPTYAVNYCDDCRSRGQNYFSRFQGVTGP